MNCTKCGKEIDNDSKFCEGCGETIVAETPTVPKKKKIKTWIILLVPVVISLILALLLLAPDSDTSNEANLGFTLAEFVDRYNSTVDAHLKQDTTAEKLAEVKDMIKLDVEYFFADEEHDDMFVAGKEDNSWGYIVLMDDSGEKVQAISFNFTKDLTEEQMEMFLIFCKWFAEAVKPDMGADYYTETLVKTIENGETRENGIAYFWDEEDNCYSYRIFYAP